jgi:hypothetical protein
MGPGGRGEVTKRIPAVKEISGDDYSGNETLLKKTAYFIKISFQSFTVFICRSNKSECKA